MFDWSLWINMFQQQINESGLSYFEVSQRAKALRVESGCGWSQCIEAVLCAEMHGDKHYEMAYLRATSFAVATPTLTFEEKVKCFIRKAK